MAWTYEINIKQYLNKEGEDNIVIIAENVAKELETINAPWIFGNLPTRLINETKAAVERIPDDEDYHNLAFNRVLNQVYNQADEYRVWLGFI